MLISGWPLRANCPQDSAAELEGCASLVAAAAGNLSLSSVPEYFSRGELISYCVTANKKLN